MLVGDEFLNAHFPHKMNSKVLKALRSSRRCSGSARSLSTAASESPLNWKQFFAQRKSRIRYENFGGVCGLALGAIGGSVYFLGIAEFDPLAPPMFGLPDASMAYFMGIFGVSFAGFVTGTLGAAPLWRLIRNKYFHHNTGIYCDKST